jgi:hypothetical protein
MKYKKQLATGALAFSLLVSGSTIYAATPQDLGIKNIGNYQRHNKEKDKNIKEQKKHNIVGTVGALSSTGFTVNVINIKMKVSSSQDIVTNATTIYKKDGLTALAADLVVGQKVIVSGDLDKTTNILTAKMVKIITKAPLQKEKREERKVLRNTLKIN